MRLLANRWLSHFWSGSVGMIARRARVAVMFRSMR